MSLIERVSDYSILQINANTKAVTLSRTCFIEKDGEEVMSKQERVEVEDNAKIAILIDDILKTAEDHLKEIKL